MPVTAKPSLRYELILNGAVRRYPDGREVCCDTGKGMAEYARRVSLMALRQHNVCGLGPHLMKVPTFEHSSGRGMNGSHRDDRIVDENGNPMNCAACYKHNSEKGSRRA